MVSKFLSPFYNSAEAKRDDTLATPSYADLCGQIRRCMVLLPFDCNSTALRPFDDIRYDRRPICEWAAALRPK